MEIMYFFIAVIASCLIGEINASSNSQNSNKKEGENHSDAISQLRALVGSELTQKFMSEDYYLEKWLQHNDYNVEMTHKLFMQFLEYRAKEKIDTILDEDWAGMRKRFPYSRETFDKEGRPVLYIDLESWDIATFLGEDSKAEEKLARYIAMFHEESDAHVRHLREEGVNVTKFVEIYNLAGFSPFKHACVHCLQFYRKVGDIRTPFATVNFEKAVLLNVPYLFKMVYYFLSDQSQSYMTIYGQDRDQWEPMLLQMMDADQIPRQLRLDQEPTNKDNAEGLMNWRKEL